MTDLLSYSHLFFAALVLAGPIVALVLLGRPFDMGTAKRLRQVDLVNGIAATLVLYGVASGLSLVSTLEIKRWAAPLKAGRVPVVTEQKRGQMGSALG